MKKIVFLSLILFFSIFSNPSLSKVENAEGEALLIHGLNLNVAKMNDLALIMAYNNFFPNLLKLKGHQGSYIENEATMKQVTYQDWVDETTSALKELGQKAQKKKSLALGFSLGGSLLLNVIQKNPNLAPDYLILLAPAINFPWYNNLINLFGIFGDDYIVPSFNVESYKAGPGTSVGAYKALEQLAEELDKNPYPKIKSKILLILAPSDELVDSDGVEKWFNAKNVGKKIVYLDNELSTLKGNYSHLIITRESLGDQAYQHLNKSINSFIDDFR